nr:hypothetical transcript [Hymenolepis microstoma]
MCIGSQLNFLSSKLPVIAICGATGTGKSKLAIDLARQLNSEVINVDAVQLYRGLDIATNKVKPEEADGIVHHLLGCLDPIDGFYYNVHHYRRDCCRLIGFLRNQNKAPILVGGTHYYLEAVLWRDFLRISDGHQDQLEFHSESNFKVPSRSWPSELLAQLPPDPKDYYATLMNLDPESALRHHPNDTRKLQQAILAHLACMNVDAASPTNASILSSHRSECPRYPPPESLIFWLDADSEVLKPKLDERVSKMISRGLVRELDGFLTMAAKSFLSNQSVVNSDENVSQEEKKAVFQLANNGLLPSTGTEHWCRGVLQSIGFKEFDEYLQLSPAERDSKQGQAMLVEAIERMKTATKRYSKRQVGWINNRFIRRSATGGIPVYRIDVTPILTASTPEMVESLWTSLVLEPCLATLRGECSPPALSPEPFVESNSEPSSYSSSIPPPPYICASCNGAIFVNYSQFQDHLGSRRHKKRLASLKKRATNANRFFMRKYASLFISAESHWNQHFGEYVKNYSMFKSGISKTFADLRRYLSLTVSRVVASDAPQDGLSSLGRNDLRIIRTVPGDLAKLAPLLAIVALPGTVAILPILKAFSIPHFVSVDGVTKSLVGWINNRFIRRSATGGIPVYRIDVTPILTASTPEMVESLWTSLVLEPCLATLRGECSPPALSPEPFVESNSEPSSYSSSIPPPPYICASCNGAIFVNYSQFQDHLGSRRHKKRLASLKKRATNANRFFMRKYASLFISAESHWNQHFGEYVKNYSMFKSGISKTFADLRRYLSLTVSRVVASDAPQDGLSSLGRNDLRIIRTVPGDLAKLAPLLAIVALPGTVAILPIFLAFPHIFLTRVFWKEEQRRKFDETSLRKRLLGPNSDLTMCLTRLIDPTVNQKKWNVRRIRRNIAVIENGAYDRSLLKSLLEVLAINQIPSTVELTELIALFDGPLNLNALDHHHITFLCGLHGLVSYRKPLPGSMVYRHPFLDPILSPVNISSRLNKLEQRARIICAEDRDMANDFRKNSPIPHKEVKELCLTRGLNSYAFGYTDLLSRLRNWTELSIKASDTSHSYRLHLPFLLNYKKYL